MFVKNIKVFISLFVFCFTIDAFCASSSDSFKEKIIIIRNEQPQIKDLTFNTNNSYVFFDETLQKWFLTLRGDFTHPTLSFVIADKTIFTSDVKKGPFTFQENVTENPTVLDVATVDSKGLTLREKIIIGFPNIKKRGGLEKFKLLNKSRNSETGLQVSFTARQQQMSFSQFDSVMSTNGFEVYTPGELQMYFGLHYQLNRRLRLGLEMGLFFAKSVGGNGNYKALHWGYAVGPRVCYTFYKKGFFSITPSLFAGMQRLEFEILGRKTSGEAFESVLLLDPRLSFEFRLSPIFKMAAVTSYTFPVFPSVNTKGRAMTDFTTWSKANVTYGLEFQFLLPIYFN